MVNFFCVCKHYIYTDWLFQNTTLYLISYTNAEGNRDFSTAKYAEWVLLFAEIFQLPILLYCK